jgi:Flp pilus assembly protein TadB
MLNQNERRRLEAIERQLAADDPDFARRISTWPPRGAAKRSRIVLVLVLIACFLGLLLAIVAGSPALFIGSVIVGAAAVFWYRRRHRASAGPARGY